jgi:short-subunit dehydrogenase
MQLNQRESSRLLKAYGPLALVTGASSGIGKELSEQLASAGFQLILTARRKDVLDKLAADLHQKHGTEVHTIGADLSTQAGLEDLINQVQDQDIGLLVASAGFGTSGLWLNGFLESEIDMLQVNCGATMGLTHHFSRSMVARGGGGIILFSSIVAFQGTPNAANYAATKAYVQSLAEGLAVELKPHGVHVLSAAPGPVNSEFAERANMQMGLALNVGDVGVPILKALGRKTTVRPGFLSKLLATGMVTLPRWARVLLMNQIMGGMTKHQHQSGATIQEKTT